MAPVLLEAPTHSQSRFSRWQLSFIYTKKNNHINTHKMTCCVCSCMQGYINDTLSTALVSHPAIRNDFDVTQLRTETGINVTQCRWEDASSLSKPSCSAIEEQQSCSWSVRNLFFFFRIFVRSYRDYRSHGDFTLTSQFWMVLATRFAFVVLFEVCNFWKGEEGPGI